MLPLDSWESFAGFSCIGGLIGYVIWVEKNREKAISLPTMCHVVGAVRNLIVSGFLGVLAYLVCRRFNLQGDPIAFALAGVIGMLSVDAAMILMDMARVTSIDALRILHRRLTGKEGEDK